MTSTVPDFKQTFAPMVGDEVGIWNPSSTGRGGSWRKAKVTKITATGQITVAIGDYTTRFRPEKHDPSRLVEMGDHIRSWARPTLHSMGEMIADVSRIRAERRVRRTDAQATAHYLTAALSGDATDKAGLLAILAELERRVQRI